MKTKTIRKTNVKENEVKISLGILEKISLVNSIIDFATVEVDNRKEYNCNYLEIAKVYYIATNYINEKYIKKCPTITIENINDRNEISEVETLDVFKTYDKIQRDNLILNGEEKEVVRLWDYLANLPDVKLLLQMVQDRYNELKEIESNNNGFELYLKETIEEVKVKFIEVMNKIDLDELKKQQKDLPKLLNSLNGEQKKVLSNLVGLSTNKKVSEVKKK